VADFPRSVAIVYLPAVELDAQRYSAEMPLASLVVETKDHHLRRYCRLSIAVMNLSRIMLIHGFVRGSRVNGPGLRAVVYFQGCTLGCREELSIAKATDLILCANEERGIEGVTLSGGEPMQQACDLLSLVECVHSRLPALSFGMYSGYSAQELESGHYWCRRELTQVARQAIWRSIRGHLDFAVLGRYVAGRPSVLALRTSANQRLELLSDRYSERDFEPQEIEVHIGEHGFVQVTGFPVTGPLV
jgi:anaerobic ribonucleoside-triphosphate reductase activating protein